MQLTETITIINKSGKIIGNGKHFVNIFKDAKAAYQEKKAALTVDRSMPNTSAQLPIPGQLRKSHTLAALPQPEHGAPRRRESYDDDYQENDHHYHTRPRDGGDRRRSIDDIRSRADSRRSHGSHRSRRSKHHHHAEETSRPALTSRNLESLSEVSSTAPSRVPKTYRSPYAETAPRDMMLSRPTLVRANTSVDLGLVNYTAPQPMPFPRSQFADMAMAPPSAINGWHDQPPLQRQASDPSMQTSSERKHKEIDMNLAYGNIPPDLEHRFDLDPAFKEATREAQARSLMSTIDKMMIEAKCVHHTATNMIDGLQKNPEKAAAVALSLGELSTILGKLSPAFLVVVKTGFPHIFALLASPQFLVGVGVVAGVSVVCFGGWKIVKRIKEASENHKMKETAMSAQPWQGQYAPRALPPPQSYVPPPWEQQQQYSQQQHQYYPMPIPAYGYQDYRDVQYEPIDSWRSVAEQQQQQAPSHDDALVLDDGLSTIDTWRRGIPAFEDDESTVDYELITPEAVRSVREDHRHRDRHGDAETQADEAGDTREYREDNSEIADTESQRTGRTRRTHRSHKSGGTTHRRHRSEGGGATREDRESRASRRQADVRTVEDGDDGQSERSHRSSRSKRTTRTAVRAIEDGSRSRDDNDLASVLGKGNKSSMLKALFKKNDQNKSTLSIRTAK